MENCYYAKSHPPQLIVTHEQNLLRDFEVVLQYYGKFFSEILRAVISISAAHHDDGKAIFAFQNEILRAMGKNIVIEWNLSRADVERLKSIYQTVDGRQIPHGFFSPMFVNWKPFYEKYGKPAYFLALMAICFHHVREVEVDREQLKRAMREDLQPRFPDKHLSSVYLNRLKLPQELTKEQDWCQFAVAVGMLNRLDYHASSGVDVPVEIEPQKDGKTIAETVEQKLKQTHGSLREVQVYMKANAGKNVVVTASTGLGKTEAALLWNGGGKLFYTLPLKVSINAIYERIRDNYAFGEEHTTLLHSDAASILLQEQGGKTDETEENALLKYRVTRMFAFPVTVCTVDQLFTYVYRYRGCEPLLATLSYSNVVLDEVQAYSPELMARIIYALRLMAQVGGHFAILTATLPPVFAYYLKENFSDLPETMQPVFAPQPYFSTFRRRHMLWYAKGEMDCLRILQAAQDKRVLVICNTIASAQALYRSLRKQAGGAVEIHLLHAHFIRAHRKLLENEIQIFGKGERGQRHGIWISTQIVEASLDIDFDLLVTEMCPADSLLQRMGRCWRSREYTGMEPNVWIYDNGNGLGSRSVYQDDTVNRHSADGLQRYLQRDTFTEEDKDAYIRYVFDIEAMRAAPYGETLETELNRMKHIFPSLYDQKDAQKNFRDIHSIQVIPDSIYEASICPHADGWTIDMAISEMEKSHDARRKVQARKFLDDRSFSIQKYGRLSKDVSVINDIISKKYNIYRIHRKYEFFSADLQGEGLSDESEEQKIW